MLWIERLLPLWPSEGTPCLGYAVFLPRVTYYCYWSWKDTVYVNQYCSLRWDLGLNVQAMSRSLVATWLLIYWASIQIHFAFPSSKDRRIWILRHFPACVNYIHANRSEWIAIMESWKAAWIICYLTTMTSFISASASTCYLAGQLDGSHFTWIVNISFANTANDHLQLNVTFPTHSCCPKAVLYLDFQMVNMSAQMSCQERENIAEDSLNQIIVFDPKNFWSGCQEKDDFTHCSAQRTFRASVPRTWFIAISQCESEINGLEYSLEAGSDGKLECPSSDASFVRGPGVYWVSMLLSIRGIMIQWSEKMWIVTILYDTALQLLLLCIFLWWICFVLFCLVFFSPDDLLMLCHWYMHVLDRGFSFWNHLYTGCLFICIFSEAYPILVVVVVFVIIVVVMKYCQHWEYLLIWIWLGQDRSSTRAWWKCVPKLHNVFAIVTFGSTFGTQLLSLHLPNISCMRFRFVSLLLLFTNVAGSKWWPSMYSYL